MRSRVFNITDTANATTVSRHSGSLKFDQSMISLSSATRVFIVTGATDMRKSFNGLYGIVAHRLHENPLRGHVFVFCNVSRNRIKL